MTNPSEAASIDAKTSSDSGVRALENGVPLSQSLIWDRQRDYYIRRGLETWSTDNLPQFITNNPFIAEIYAKIVFGFVCDCMGLPGRESGGSSQPMPVRIVELGAGTGKLAYLFLRHLEPLLAGEGIPAGMVQYRMTDCSESVVKGWRSNSYLAEFVERGMLDFALFDACSPSEIMTRRDGKKTCGPLVVIANYVFDSLPQDAFTIRKGQVLESLLIVETEAKGDGDVSNVAPQFRLSFRDQPVPPNRYPDETWNRILELYRRLPDATVLFPSAAFNVLEQLRVDSDGRMLVLVADKGYTREDVITLMQGPPAFEWHGPECFSLMVNFDAIAKYFRATEGAALIPEKHDSNLHICAFLRGRPIEQFPLTRDAYQESQSHLGPDDLFVLLAWLNAHMEEMSVTQILAALRLTHWDPIALIRLFPVLARQLRKVVAEREDVFRAVERTWANHFPVNAGENVLAFDCGVILLELRFFKEAMAMFRTSEKVLGPSATTSYNLGLCAMGMQRSHEAMALMKEACELDPLFEPARRLMTKFEAENRSSH